MQGGNQMAEKFIFIRDLRQEAHVEKEGIVSQTLHNDERAKMILFRFRAGQELKKHKAPVPVSLTFLKGEAVVGLGAEEQEAAEGSFVYMTPLFEHSIRAKTDVIMLLIMMKQNAPALQA
jgi:quercetin dioxygenase-like cupin family protein